MKKFAVVVVMGMSLCVSQWIEAANTAGIVIQNSTGEVITRCVEFNEDSITVEDLLNRSGFAMVTNVSSFGTSICYLHDDGIPDGANCFGHPLGWFWNFFQRSEPGWVLADVGISTATASNGDIFGFGFGGFGQVELPDMTFNDVCGYSSTAGLVIDHSDGRRVILEVPFSGETTTGLQLLRQSGLDLVTSESSFGTAICAIDGEGQPQDECFGDPLGRFWAFNTLGLNNEWQASFVGAGDVVVRDGDIHGYYFSVFGSPQPDITRGEVFVNEPTPTPVLPIQTPTRTPQPASTPTPTLTATPQPQPVVVVHDNQQSLTDLSGGVDVDDSGYQELVISWSLPAAGINLDDIKDIHVYVSTDGSPFEYLARTANGTDTFYTWRWWNGQINAKFGPGPQFGHAYQFRVFALTKSESPLFYGPFGHSGPVAYQSSVRVTDDLNSTVDLSNGQDTDTALDRSLVVRWNLDANNFDVSDVADSHVYIQLEDSAPVQYLGRTASSDRSYFEWKPGAEFIAPAFVDGPQSGVSYKFWVFVLTQSAQPFARGPFKTSGFIEYFAG